MASRVKLMAGLDIAEKRLPQDGRFTLRLRDRTIDVHIRRLRKALEDVQMDHLIQTVRGSGYRFSAKEQAG